jgi:hypothetical protein
MKTYPRLSVRVNSLGTFDVYLIKAAPIPGVWVSGGLTITAALWWVKQ